MLGDETGRPILSVSRPVYEREVARSSIPEERKGNVIRALEVQDRAGRHVDDAGVRDALLLQPFEPHFQV